MQTNLRWTTLSILSNTFTFTAMVTYSRVPLWVIFFNPQTKLTQIETKRRKDWLIKQFYIQNMIKLERGKHQWHRSCVYYEMLHRQDFNGKTVRIISSGVWSSVFLHSRHGRCQPFEAGDGGLGFGIKIHVTVAWNVMKSSLLQRVITHLLII